MGQEDMAKRDLNIKVINTITKDKRYQRLIKIDAMLVDLRARGRDLYQERLKIVGELYARDADNASGG